VTPFEWTRGKLPAMVASLLVTLSGQVLRWQEPASAMAEIIHRSLRCCRRPPKALLLSQTSTNYFQRINMQSP
jgi:hypothetical protein